MVDENPAPTQIEALSCPEDPGENQDGRSPLAVCVRQWACLLRTGQFDRALVPSDQPVLAEIHRELNAVAAALREARLGGDHSHSALGVRYEIAARAADYRDLDDLLIRSLHSLKHVVSAEAAMVWLLSDSGEMELAASTGLGDELLMHEQLHTLHKCMCDAVSRERVIHFQAELRDCEEAFGRPLFESSGIGMIAVPLLRDSRCLGVYNLFIHKEKLKNNAHLETMLAGIARHMCMGIENARLNEQALQKSIMEERIRIAHELHDSLAQSMASIRFQVRVLDQTLHAGDEEATWQEMERVEHSLDIANRELRELISHFRAPRDERNILLAIEELVERFRQDTGLHVFVQKDWHKVSLPKEVEIQIYRILQEALSNVKKHSRAKTVRLLLRHDGRGRFHALVEDDGIGIRFRDIDDLGEHFGVKVMRERAQKIGGDLRIEGEPDEGTQVTLDFTWTNAPRTDIRAEEE